MQRYASAIWRGSLKEGQGTVSTASGVLSETPYSFRTRFEQGAGTNPEELIAAAHAGCFAMALSAQLGEAGVTPERIEAKATVTLEKTAAGWEVTASHLEVRARIVNADRALFERTAEAAKAGCPISRLLKAKITLKAELE
jgi:osmotically inducible protein OsmC